MAAVSSTPTMKSSTTAAPAIRPAPMPSAGNFCLSSAFSCSISAAINSLTRPGRSVSSVSSDRLGRIGSVMARYLAVLDEPVPGLFLAPDAGVLLADVDEVEEEPLEDDAPVDDPLPDF